jgi:hypothetical protein
MLEDSSLIFSVFLVALAIIPFAVGANRNSLRPGGTAFKTAVVNGMVVVALLLQYGHLMYVATYAPHHSAWTMDSTYVRYDCVRSQKGGKMAGDFRDCLLGQGDACTVAEPCTPCPAGGDALTLSAPDWHRYLGNYSRLLCRNCTEPYRANFDCHFGSQWGPYCLVDHDAYAAAVLLDESGSGSGSGSNKCPGTSMVELPPRQELQLPLAMQQQLGLLEDVGRWNQTWLELAYGYPLQSQVACRRCCSKHWDESLLIPPDPVVEPFGGLFTSEVEVFFTGVGVYYTLDGSDPDPCRSNGFWVVDPEEPLVLQDVGTTVLRAIATFRGYHSRVVVEAVFEITDCSDEWFLEMSTQYPTGGLANDKDAVTDQFAQLTGAGTGDSENDNDLSRITGNWIALRFSAIIFMDVVRCGGSVSSGRACGCLWMQFVCVCVGAHARLRRNLRPQSPPPCTLRNCPQLTLSVYERDRWDREQVCVALSVKVCVWKGLCVWVCVGGWVGVCSSVGGLSQD